MLQRVRRKTDARTFAEMLSVELGAPVRCAEGLDDVTDISVSDARSVRMGSFEGWDARRRDLVPAGAQRVVLLDVASAALVALQAPHTVSWCGGIALPVETAVRGVATEDELAEGSRALARWASELPADSPWHGARVGIDLLTERVFAAPAHGDPLTAALDALDEGTIYVGVVP